LHLFRNHSNEEALKEETTTKNLSFYPQNNHEVNKIFKIILDNYLPIERVSLVIDETLPVIIFEESYNEKDDILTLPPEDVIAYSLKDFEALIKTGVIDFFDAEFMYSSVDSSKVCSINSKAINKPSISRLEQYELFSKGKDQTYDILRDKYGTSCFAKFGTPLFNKDSTKVLVTVHKYCGRLNGLGSRLVLIKKNGKWIIAYDTETWVS